MKKLIALTLALLMLALPALSEAPCPAADGATLTVTGSAAVTLKADYAQVSVGVATSAATVEEATALNGEAIRSVVAALTEAGIPEEDVATSSYTVYAEYDYSSGQSVLIGYNVSNQLTVIIRDMTAVGATLDKATAAGANSIHSVTFCSTLSSDAQDEAMTYALQDAIRKGQLLANAAGLTIGGILSITENPGVHYTVTTTYKVSADRAATSNVILPDDLTVSASVTIVFELTSPIAPAASASITGSYEVFHMADSKGYFQWAQEMFPSDKILGAVLNAEDALLNAQALWSEAFEGYDRTSQGCTVSYDPDSGVWLVKSPLTSEADGGTARVLIRAEDGQVLAVWHSK